LKLYLGISKLKNHKTLQQLAQLGTYMRQCQCYNFVVMYILQYMKDLTNSDILPCF